MKAVQGSGPILTPEEREEVVEELAAYIYEKGPKGREIVNRWLRKHRSRVRRIKSNAVGGAP